MSLPAPFAAAGLTVHNTFGSTLLGLIGASILFGITSLQTYLYYHHYPKDSLLHRFAVGFLWALDALHLAITAHAVYFYIISHYGQFTIEVVWTLKVQILVNAIVICSVQSLYAYRVWLLGGYHKGVLGYLVAAVVVGGLVIGIVLTYEIFKTDTFIDIHNFSWAIYASFSASTTIDFVLAIAMCYYLRKSKDKGVHSRLNSRISMIMQYTLSTGLFTSACSLGCLFAYALSPNTLIYVGVQFLLIKCYVVSFLAMLNARKRDDNTNSTPATSRVSGVGLPSITLKSPTNRSLMGASPITGPDRPWDNEVEMDTLPDAKYTNRGHYTTSPTEKKVNYQGEW